MKFNKLKKLRKALESRRFRVGLMTLLATGLFAGMVLFILGASLGSRMDTYHVLFDESVKGMVVGSKVNFQGIPVGSVTDIRFQNGKTRVSVGIDPEKAQIQECTRAHMDRLLITGQVTVELEGYQRKGRLLPEGEVIPAKLSAFDAFTRSLPDVISTTDDLLGDLRQLVSRLSETLSDDNRKALTTTMRNVALCSDVLAKRLDGLIGETVETMQTVRPAMRSMEKSFAHIGELAGGEDVRQTMRSARHAMERLDLIEKQLNGLLTELTGLARGSRRQLLEALTSARGAMEEMRQFARDLRMAPNSVIYGRKQGTAVPTAPGK